MKTLQNNFTTPEQSKRLLELGVPANSADCYLTRFGIDEDWEVKVLNNNIKFSELEISNQDYCLPCWSVGRLIEITLKCSILELAQVLFDTTLYEISCLTNIEWAINVLESSIKCEHIDFSKLED